MFRLPLVSVLFLLPLAFCCVSGDGNKDNPHKPKSPSLLGPLPQKTGCNLRSFLKKATNFIYDTDEDIFEERAKQTEQFACQLLPSLESKYGNHFTQEYTRRSEEESSQKNELTAKLLEIEEKVAKMFLTVVHVSADEPVDQETLDGVKKFRQEMISTFAKFSSLEKMESALKKLEEIHGPVLDNFKNTVYGKAASEIRAKREVIDEKKVYQDIADLLTKLTVYGYGVTENHFITKSIIIPIKNLGAAISFKRFIQANYRHILKNDIDLKDVEIEEKTREMGEIVKIEEEAAKFWSNEIRSDIENPWQIVVEINADIQLKLNQYIHFRTLDEVKETKKKAQIFYGILEKSEE